MSGCWQAVGDFPEVKDSLLELLPPLLVWLLGEAEAEVGGEESLSSLASPVEDAEAALPCEKENKNLFTNGFWKRAFFAENQ